MASSPSSPSSANDVLISHSSNHPDPHMSSSSSDNQDHTSVSPSQDHCHISPSADTDQSEMTSPTEGASAIASASVLETIKAPQSRLGFLSLPPEIRNMIYGFLFKPVQDGSCWAVRANFRDTSLRGVRLPCYLCSNGSIHTFCKSVHAQQITTVTAYTAFTLPNKHIHSNIHQTCRTIREESLSISLAHMRISMKCRFNGDDPFYRGFLAFLTNMGQPKGAHLAALNVRSFDPQNSKLELDKPSCLSRIINEHEITIGHLELDECWLRGLQPVSLLEFFVDFVQSLNRVPITVRWVPQRSSSRLAYKDEMDAFNEAVGIWLEATSISKAKGSGLKMPLLRDFLPKYFDQPQT
ncbi:hypothetical protein M438DRAFT_338400 [Aureobasidium pullulans EXF-150]|uniref:Uncharacterized protein n=1 Tax=Aureobasidium pullulans EXF-150 TaxID=1043002 RepID=A0A074XBB4_AURPU|nr:uncharacterized protein M438DRAFT_338400 [Aureobasidium pullulans EXF-150]KEQ81019.1 hypothetical protein M438DRAFT_338400 [Aureobasidium pullulans EXF-150]